MSTRTDKEPASYPSHFSHKLVPVTSYLVEIVSQRQAKLRGESLSEGYWKRAYWDKYYKLQMIQARALLKLFNEIDIIRALNYKGGQKIYSLGAPWLQDLIRECQEIREKKQVVAEEKANVEVTPVEVVVEGTKRPTFNPNRKSKLDE